jgi:hypothetical protein
MDRVIKIAIALFVLVSASFAAGVLYTSYVENSFRSSLESTYSYTCTITADSPINNVTFFVPVPDTPGGASPIVSAYSARQIHGLPPGWEATLFGTGKGTTVKITGPGLKTAPYLIALAADIITDRQIETGIPSANGVLSDGVMFRPLQNAKEIPCPAGVQGNCREYTVPVYADYQAGPNTRVTVSSTLRGKNTWNVFGPGYNEYRANTTLLLFGDQQGWTSAYGTLIQGIGSAAPVRLSP